MDIVNFIEKIVPGVITAFIAAFLAAWLSLNRYYKEKWWDRKAKAYSELIEAFYDLMSYYDFKSEEFMGMIKPSEELQTLMEEKRKTADLRIKKASDIGEFVISKKAATALRDYRNRPELKWRNGENELFEVCDAESYQCRQTLKQIKEYALKDLRKRSILERIKLK